jgi:hypothetical protein
MTVLDFNFGSGKSINGGQVQQRRRNFSLSEVALDERLSVPRDKAFDRLAPARRDEFQ